MITQKELKQKIPFVQEWLDERWLIILDEEKEEDGIRPADLAYYKGALQAIEFLGFSWKRFENGKHTIY